MTDPESDRLAAGRPKLVESKEKWARDGRLLTGHTARPDVDRLPPGQREVRDWPVLDLGEQPQIAREDWRLRVDGAVEAPLDWGWEDLMVQPQVEDVSDIHCVTAWSRFENRWRGVRMSHVLGLARPSDDARFAVLHSYDGYDTNLPLSFLLEPEALLAYEWEGRPLEREHGGPVRALIPRLYLWKSAKWLNRIELITEDRPGFWEQRGYHEVGDPWEEQRYG